MITKCGMRFKVDSFGRGPCGAFKGPARGQCLNCMDEQEYDLTAPVNPLILFLLGVVVSRLFTCQSF